MPLFEWLLLFDEDAEEDDDEDVEISPLPPRPLELPLDGFVADSIAPNSLFFIKYFSSLASICLP